MEERRRKDFLPHRNTERECPRTNDRMNTQAKGEKPTQGETVHHEPSRNLIYTQGEGGEGERGRGGEGGREVRSRTFLHWNTCA